MYLFGFNNIQAKKYICDRSNDVLCRDSGFQSVPSRSQN